MFIWYIFSSFGPSTKKNLATLDAFHYSVISESDEKMAKLSSESQKVRQQHCSALAPV
jgi:hypothetical protein